MPLSPFRGADHAFLWKPKLRIPDIYESDKNQIAFGHLLHTCNCCDSEDAVIAAIHEIDKLRIKGLRGRAYDLDLLRHRAAAGPRPGRRRQRRTGAVPRGSGLKPLLAISTALY